MSTISYTIGNNLYLNITNRCTNKCSFCIRSKTKKLNNEYELWLDKEPSSQEIISSINNSINNPNQYKEIVFCGYGEPLIRLNTVIEIAKHLKKSGATIRIDSNGQANIYHKKDVVPAISNFIDKISISLNAHDASTYQKICNSEYKSDAFDEVISFATKCKDAGIKTNFSVVNLPIVDIETCKKIAKKVGIPLKVRAYYEEDYAGFTS
jgi:TatD family-associated radical SAM protein